MADNSPTKNKESTKSMSTRLKDSAPYNLFFSKIPGADESLNGNNCITFADLLCPSLGKLESCLHLTYLLDINWLFHQYEVQNLQKTPMTILYEKFYIANLQEYVSETMPNVSLHQLILDKGHHHSKICVFKYENDIIRIVVMSANLCTDSWGGMNHGVWISPPLPKMHPSKKPFDCVGPAGFKSDFLNYLKGYKLDLLQDWIKIVGETDFTPVNVYFIYSTPGAQFPQSHGSHFYRVGDLLSKHCSLPVEVSDGDDSWDVIAQVAALGNFGTGPNDWLNSHLLRALASHKDAPLHATASHSNANLKLIYPSKKNVEMCSKGEDGDSSVPLTYDTALYVKQRWLHKYLYVWKADKTGRSEQLPHIKCFMRISPCLKKLAWFLLTSGNAAKGAWGSNINKKSGAIYGKSYEAGVLFMPHLFGEEYFHIDVDEGDERCVFPLMFDLPLVGYEMEDEPYHCAIVR